MEVHLRLGHQPPHHKKDYGHAKAGPDTPTNPTTRRLTHHVDADNPPKATGTLKKVCPTSFLAGQTSEVVELGGFEPPTFSLRTRRATNCAIAPSAC